jgi:hypothetical protein
MRSPPITTPGGRRCSPSIETTVALWITVVRGAAEAIAGARTASTARVEGIRAIRAGRRPQFAIAIKGADSLVF